MLIPILRLVLIYVVLTLVVVGVFNRDSLMRLLRDDPPAVAAPSLAPAAPITAAPAPVMSAPAPSASIAQPQTPVVETPPATAATEAATEADLAIAINAARVSYWAGDVAGARAQLIALAGAHPDNADLRGELGNLYFSQRDYPSAATAYLEAADLLIAQERHARASGLLPVLQQIDPQKAATLAARLQNR